MTFERLQKSLRESGVQRILSMAAEQNWITLEDAQRLAKEGDAFQPDSLVRMGLVSPLQLARLLRWERDMDRAVLLERKLGADLPSQVAPRLRVPGALLGKYVLVDELGSGGMGTVYRAWDTELRRWVALKLLRESESDEARRRFVREARTAAGLDHPGIVPVYEAGQIEGESFIAMKPIEGRSLEAAVVSTREAARIIRDAARAVHAAHSLGIIHRDLKPANILIEEKTGQVFVSDFGLAREIRAQDSLTATNIALGTPPYMSPEQARGAALDAQTDVYALGATLYQLLTGRPPFARPTTAEILQAVLQEPAVLPRKIEPSVPRDLEAIVMRAIEKDPQNRYPSAESLARELDAFLAGERISATRYTVIRRATLWVGRHQAFALTFALLVALACGAATVYRLVQQNRLKTELAAAHRYEQTEEWTLALQKYSAVLAIDPNHDEAKRQADYIRSKLDAQSKHHDAEEAFTPTLDRLARLPSNYEGWAEGIRLLDEAEKTFGGMAELHLKRGELLRLAGNAPRALADLTRALEINPKRLIVYYERGLVYRDLLHDRDKALAEFETLLKLDPDNEFAQLGRARVALIRNDDAAAARICSEIVGRAGRLPELWFIWATALAGKESLPKFEELFKLDPNHYLGLANRAAVLLDLEDYRGALRDANRAIEIAPNYPEGYCHRTSARIALNDYAGAIEDGTRAIKLSDKYTDAYVNRGRAFAMLKKHKEAIQDFDEAIKLEPGVAIPWNDRGASYGEMGDHEHALADFNKAVELKPDYANAIANRGYSHYMMKAYAKAIADWKHAIELDGSYRERLQPLIQQAQKLLGEF